jgi:hypothetical protein
MGLSRKSVTKEVPDANNVQCFPAFLNKVFDGPYRGTTTLRILKILRVPLVNAFLVLSSIKTIHGFSGINLLNIKTKVY